MYQVAAKRKIDFVPACRLLKIIYKAKVNFRLPKVEREIIPLTGCPAKIDHAVFGFDCQAEPCPYLTVIVR